MTDTTGQNSTGTTAAVLTDTTAADSDNYVVPQEITDITRLRTTITEQQGAGQ